MRRKSDIRSRRSGDGDQKSALAAGLGPRFSTLHESLGLEQASEENRIDAAEKPLAAVDLDDGNPQAVSGCQLGVALDVYLFWVEPLVTKDALCLVAKVTTAARVKDDGQRLRHAFKSPV
jgi:hypothetical protein